MTSTDVDHRAQIFLALMELRQLKILAPLSQRHGISLCSSISNTMTYVVLMPAAQTSHLGSLKSPSWKLLTLYLAYSLVVKKSLPRLIRAAKIKTDRRGTNVSMPSNLCLTLSTFWGKRANIQKRCDCFSPLNKQSWKPKPIFLFLVCFGFRIEHMLSLSVSLPLLLAVDSLWHPALPSRIPLCYQ